jgi:hypothetical protein
MNEERLTLASFLTEICGFDLDISVILAQFGVATFEDFAFLRESYLTRWFDRPCQVAILCRLQMVHSFIELGSDPRAVTDSSDLRVQTSRLVRAAKAAPLPSVEDSSSSHSNTTIDEHDLVRLKFPDGRVLECSRSTLVNRGGYLAARFGDNGIPAGAQSRDTNGQSVYFIERDGGLFEKHILCYLWSNRPGKLKSFSQDPQLWRMLRIDADFYALDGLSEILNVTMSFKSQLGEDRGVLYWLGTDKGMREYRNPHAIGAVRVGGWCDMSREEITALRMPAVNLRLGAVSQTSLEAMVQYRPAVKGVSASDDSQILWARDHCYSLACNFSCHSIATGIDLRSITLRLTAYSLRYDQCGMSYWNLEGSQDGSEWQVLHEARNDCHLLPPFPLTMRRLKEDLIDSPHVSEEEKTDILLSYVEKYHRHTWNISSNIFYRYFRLIGCGANNMPEGADVNRCMHGVGIELYGDVHED